MNIQEPVYQALKRALREVDRAKTIADQHHDYAASGDCVRAQRALIDTLGRLEEEALRVDNS